MPFCDQFTKISMPLSKEEKQELLDKLIKNFDLFAWATSDMLGIDTKVVIHHLVIHPSSIPVARRKRKVDEENRIVIDKEVGKPSDIRFITETKYSTWMANVVLV